MQLHLTGDVYKKLPHALKTDKKKMCTLILLQQGYLGGWWWRGWGGNCGESLKSPCWSRDEVESAGCGAWCCGPHYPGQWTIRRYFWQTLHVSRQWSTSSSAPEIHQCIKFSFHSTVPDIFFVALSLEGFKIGTWASVVKTKKMFLRFLYQCYYSYYVTMDELNKNDSLFTVHICIFFPPSLEPLDHIAKCFCRLLFFSDLTINYIMLILATLLKISQLLINYCLHN